MRNELSKLAAIRRGFAAKWDRRGGGDSLYTSMRLILQWMNKPVVSQQETGRVDCGKQCRFKGIVGHAQTARNNGD